MQLGAVHPNALVHGSEHANSVWQGAHFAAVNWRQERTILFEERRFGRFGDIVDLARLASADSGELLNSKQIEQVDFLGLAASRVHFIAFQSHVQSFSV